MIVKLYLASLIIVYSVTNVIKPIFKIFIFMCRHSLLAHALKSYPCFIVGPKIHWHYITNTSCKSSKKWIWGSLYFTSNMILYVPPNTECPCKDWRRRHVADRAIWYIKHQLRGYHILYSIFPKWRLRKMRFPVQCDLRKSFLSENKSFSISTVELWTSCFKHSAWFSVTFIFITKFYI